MTTKGYGESRPIDTNDTDKGRSNNRRVELKPMK
jgi:OOP family OmpA-OmpF porin